MPVPCRSGITLLLALVLMGCSGDRPDGEAPATRTAPAPDPQRGTTTAMTPVSALLDSPAIARVLFHPRRADDVSSDGAHRDVRFPVADSVTLAGRLHIAGETAPLVLLWHGNGEVATDYETLAPRYLRMGISLLVVDFRGYGDSSGTPTAGALVADGPRVWEALPKVLEAAGVRPAKMFVMGRSLGSVPAIETASRGPKDLAGLIIESGFAHTLPLAKRLGGRLPTGADEGRDGFGNHEKMRRVTAATLILHGERDGIIPVADGRDLHKACGAGEKRLVTIPGAGHNDILYVGGQTYLDAVREHVLGTAAE